jgi:hypothetical protein
VVESVGANLWTLCMTSSNRESRDMERMWTTSHMGRRSASHSTETIGEVKT